MRHLLDQIERGVNAELYSLSFYVALSIPDICGALESQNGEASGQKYADWFNRYISSKYEGTLLGEDCYILRCSLLHQGRSLHPKSRFKRIVFIEPNSSGNIFHNNILNDALNIDVRIFCRDIINGALEWLNEVEKTELFIKNYNIFFKRYPLGLAPYVVGCPIFT